MHNHNEVCTSEAITIRNYHYIYDSYGKWVYSRDILDTHMTHASVSILVAELL